MMVAASCYDFRVIPDMLSDHRSFRAVSIRSGVFASFIQPHQIIPCERVVRKVSSDKEEAQRLTLFESAK